MVAAGSNLDAEIWIADIEPDPLRNTNTGGPLSC